MVDRITKQLRKLPKKDRDAAERIMLKIRRGDTRGLDIKKLRGSDNLFRVRRGRVRVMYIDRGKKRYEIIDVDLRADTTYKRY